MPPFALVDLEAVAHHGLLEYHAVAVLFFGNRLVGSDLLTRKDVGMRRNPEIVKGTAHVNIFLQFHVEKGEIDGRAACVAAFPGHILLRHQHSLVQLRVEILLMRTSLISSAHAMK